MRTGDDQELNLRLRVTCAEMPPDRFHEYDAVQLGIQQKEAIHPGVLRGDGALCFECPVRARRDPATGLPNFLGPFVHGPRGARFLYLTWTGRRSGEREMFRRMKIHLSGISWEEVTEAAASGVALEARVSGTGRDGGPACASVPLLDGGWSVAGALTG